MLRNGGYSAELEWNMRESLKEYCSHYGREELLLQWHPDKNGDLSPEALSFGSHTQVWWRCGQGHEWQSPVYLRTGKAGGCPFCAGKRIAPGADFASVYPRIAAQWHPHKNGASRPDGFLPGSHKSVWWRCDRGHEWKAMIKTRVEGKGCPVCNNRNVIPGENDLCTVAPTLVLEWHPDKNGGLMPSEVSAGSSRKVWWRCQRGHEWQSQIQSRYAGKGCPVCAGRVVIPGENDLKTHAPEIAAQWHTVKNDGVKPDEVALHSNKAVWWRCDRGHEWKATVYSRTFSRSDCPYCAGRKVLPGFNDLATVAPKVAAQWHPTLNKPLEPSMVMPGCSKKVWWKCADGHVWKAVIYSRTGKQLCGCPVCAGRTGGRHRRSVAISAVNLKGTI